MEKHVFYFTYGSDQEENGHPYEGGWSVVEAPDMGSACSIFRAIHPDRIQGQMRCSSVYDAGTWGTTKMAQNGNNFGAACHEKIIWEVYTK